MNAAQLAERLMDLSVRVAKVVDALPDTRIGRHVAGQLARCGTASAPNYEEACAAESRADFVHKISVALKEMRETNHWLRFAARAALLSEKKLGSLITESEELKKILGKSKVTAKFGAKSGEVLQLVG